MSKVLKVSFLGEKNAAPAFLLWLLGQDRREIKPPLALPSAHKMGLQGKTTFT